VAFNGERFGPIVCPTHELVKRVDNSEALWEGSGTGDTEDVLAEAAAHLVMDLGRQTSRHRAHAVRSDDGFLLKQHQVLDETTFRSILRSWITMSNQETLAPAGQHGSVLRLDLGGGWEGHLDGTTARSAVEQCLEMHWPWKPHALAPGPDAVVVGPFVQPPPPGWNCYLRRPT
jgi:hypothetical protein